MAEEERIISIEEQLEELKKRWRQLYTPEEYAQAFVAPNYPKPFRMGNTQATRDTIMHYVDGIGDINPLYRDEEYAKKTKYGRLIAPPTFLYSVCSGIHVPELKGGVHGWDGGSEWEWFRPIYEGDEIDWRSVYPSDAEIKQSKMAGKALIVYSENELVNQKEETIAIYKQWATHAETGKATEIGKYAQIAKTHEYSEEDIREIYAAQDRETVRGAEPRYWEDVELGEELPPVVHGPLSIWEMVAFMIAQAGPAKSDRLARMIEPMLSGGGFFDPVTKVKLHLDLPHLDENLAKRVGAPGRYDIGIQRVSWLSMPLTNWIGDDGFLWKLRGELRGFNMTGDTTWCKGKVVRKYSDNGKYCVDIECWGENQRGEVTMPGKATVILPSREYGPVVYPSPRHIV
jgi:acyl dehydratase